MKLEKEKIVQALLKKALGYDAEETTEEFVVDEQSGRLKKNKKKISKKHLPPDITAVKTLLGICEDDLKNKYESMSEKELLEEKTRLLKLLLDEEEKQSEN